jgi:hypothetical protein
MAIETGNFTIPLAKNAFRNERVHPGEIFFRNAFLANGIKEGTARYAGTVRAEL